MTDVLGEIVSDVGTKVCERGKAVSFAADALEFEHVCHCVFDEERENGEGCK